MKKNMKSNYKYYNFTLQAMWRDKLLIMNGS